MHSRTFVPASQVERFVESVKAGGNQAKVNALLRPHLGQWVRLDGFMYACTTGRTSHRAMIELERNGPSVTLDFASHQESLLAHYDWGTPIKLIAQIVDDDGSLELANAEIV